MVAFQAVIGSSSMSISQVRVRFIISEFGTSIDKGSPNDGLIEMG